MERRKCGRHALDLPILGVGCWAFGGGSYWGEQSQTEVDAVVAAALDHGINYFDTAEGYNEGRSETALGQALGDRRGQAIIGSKIAPQNTDRQTLKEHCDASLRRLRTDYIDLYMFHWPPSKRSIANRSEVVPSFAEAVETMKELKQQGKIRSYGLSNFGLQQLDEAFRMSEEFVVDQLAYNLLSRAIEFEIFAKCRELGLGILGYSPLMQGILSGKYRTFDEIPAYRTRTRHFRGDRPRSRHREKGVEEATMKALAAIGEIASSAGCSMGQLSLAWSTNNPNITCTLVGARTVDQLEDNIRGAQMELSDDIVGELNSATDLLKQQLGSSPDYYNSRAESRTW